MLALTRVLSEIDAVPVTHEDKPIHLTPVLEVIKAERFELEGWCKRRTRGEPS